MVKTGRDLKEWESKAPFALASQQLQWGSCGGGRSGCLLPRVACRVILVLPSGGVGCRGRLGNVLWWGPSSKKAGAWWGASGPRRRWGSPVCEPGAFITSPTHSTGPGSPQGGVGGSPWQCRMGPESPPGVRCPRRRRRVPSSRQTEQAAFWGSPPVAGAGCRSGRERAAAPPGACGGARAAGWWSRWAFVRSRSSLAAERGSTHRRHPPCIRLLACPLVPPMPCRRCESGLGPPQPRRPPRFPV